jgi:hypothetical protein
MANAKATCDPLESGSLFESELRKTGFTVFQRISDHGYFSWTPSGPNKDLNCVTSKEEITERINWEETPKQLVRVSDVKLPQTFKTELPDQLHVNTFPYGQIDVAFLYVASQHCGVEFDKVDFAFGGSVLWMLANKDTSDPYTVTRVPGQKKTILVARQKQNVRNYSDVGFQFERLMTGGRFEDRHEVKFVNHLQEMLVGSHRVLIRGEVDAQLSGEPVEVKSGNPAWFGTRVLFQMISNGSPRLCHGVKSYGILSEINVTLLSQVASTAALCNGPDVNALEHNILAGMRSIQEQMQNAAEGEVFMVDFSTGSLHLLPTDGSIDLFPPAQVARELLGVSDDLERTKGTKDHR